MKRTKKKSKSPHPPIDNSLVLESLRRFENGEATPESLYYLIAGALTVYDEMVNQGEAGQNASQILDIIQHRVTESKTNEVNSRRKLWSFK